MLLVPLGVLAAGLIALVAGAEWLVRGASRLAAMAGVSPLVVGLTVVAFGTSAPELAVSLTSCFAGQAGIAVGNVVGSNIFNVLFILGLCAMIVPLKVAQQVVRLEIPLMIAASVLFYLMSLDGKIGRLDGLFLFGGIVTYTVWAIRKSRQESKRVQAEYAQEFGSPAAAPGQPRRGIWAQLLLIIAGLTLLVLGSQWCVKGAVAIAKQFGLSDLVIGLTIVAAGTSLPELVTSIMAGLKGERDIAVGNVVGSNIFNILCILGACGLAAPGGVPIQAQTMSLDMPVMIAVALACLPVFFTGQRISRLEGAFFFGYYILYVIYLILASTGHANLLLFKSVIIWFVAPLTAITLTVSLRNILPIKR